jgi:raffinose/stachyose/melibiose transport system substrate-binding protein
MKKVKWLLVVVSLLTTVSLFGGTGMAAKKVKIELFNSKGEIQSQLEDMAKLFSKENRGLSMEIIPCPAGQSPFERVSVLYSSGMAPTLLMLDGGDLPKLKNKFVNLSKEKWVKDAADNTLDDGKIDGKVIAFPFAVEGYGFIYNKAVLTKCFGDKFDPASIKTIKDLGNTFKKVAAAGMAPLIVSPMDWSLAAHFLAIAYREQSKNPAVVNKFLQNLQKGKADLNNNKVFNGLLDTFDLMKKYNQAKADPLAVTYEKGPEVLGKGQVAFWFMGNWAWPQIKSFDTTNGAYGFIPVPTSNDPNDYANSQIIASPTKMVAIDASQNSKKQQAAAKKFLKWLVYSKSGQNALVNKCNIIPAFKNITMTPADPLAKSIKQFLVNKKTMPAMNVMPPDHWAHCGALMQKYLAGKSDRAALLKGITDYWKNLKNFRIK